MTSCLLCLAPKLDWRTLNWEKLLAEVALSVLMWPRPPLYLKETLLVGALKKEKERIVRQYREPIRL